MTTLWGGACHLLKPDEQTYENEVPMSERTNGELAQNRLGQNQGFGRD
jgi:hypothetical protein